MSYRTSFRAHVYDCPEEQRPAVVRVLMEDFGLEFAGPVSDPLNLAWPYGAEQAALDTGEELAPALAQAAPGASFYLWADPSDSDVGPVFGEMRAYTPALGHFTAECDQHGNPAWLSSQVLDLIARATAGGQLNRTRLRTSLGLPWSEDYAPHRPDWETA